MRLLLAGEDRFGQGPFLSIEGDTHEVVGFAGTADEAVELADSLHPDAVLLELGMSGIARRLSGLATVVILSHGMPRTGVGEVEPVAASGRCVIKAALALATAHPTA